VLEELHPVVLPLAGSTAGSLLIPATAIDHYAVAYTANRAGPLIQVILHEVIGRGPAVPGESQTRLAFSLALSRYQTRRPVQSQTGEVRTRRRLALEQILH